MVRTKPGNSHANSLPDMHSFHFLLKGFLWRATLLRDEAFGMKMHASAGDFSPRAQSYPGFADRALLRAVDSLVNRLGDSDLPLFLKAACQRCPQTQYFCRATCNFM